MSDHMRTHVHSIGRQYYTRASFTKEALQYGATRRISIANLKQMVFGDRILCTIKDGKTQVVFGEFAVEKISGLTGQEAAVLSAKMPTAVTQIIRQRRLVTRGCGSYHANDIHVLSRLHDLPQLVVAFEAMKAEGHKLASLMVGGDFIELDQPVRLPTLPHGRGFRPFDYVGWCRAVAACPPSAKMPRVKGCFYATKDSEPDTDPVVLVWGAGAIETVDNYARA